MPTPPRALVALAVAAAALAGVLPSGPIPAAPVGASVVGPYVPTGSAPVAPGVTHDWGGLATTSGAQLVDVVTVDPRQPEISFEAAISNDRAVGLERTSSQAIRRSSEGHRVVAAINGDVWGTNGNDMASAPNGTHIEGGELITASPSPRPAFAVDGARIPRIGSLATYLALTTSTGAAYPVQRLNQARRSGELALYTPRFGDRTSSAATGVEVVIGGLVEPLRPVGSWTGVVTLTRPAGTAAPIDPGTAVLTVPDTSELVNLQPGEPLTITTSTTPGWESVVHAVTGRETILRGGLVAISPRSSIAVANHPRTAIGLTVDGRVVMVTVDGRQVGESHGVSLDELAEVLLARGVVDAINLDGGGSSTMAVRQPGDVDVSVVNQPSDGRERSVTNSIEVVSAAPTGPLGLITILPAGATLYERTSVTFRAVGQDIAFNGVPLLPGEVGWSVDGPAGTIDASGRFTAASAGVANVLAQARGVVASIPVTVVPDATPPVAAPPTVTLSTGRAIGVPGVPVLVSWPAATDVGTGVAGYEAQVSAAGGPWAPIALATPTSRSATVTLPRNTTYQLQVRALDVAGNASPWVVGGAFRLAVAQETTRAITFVRGTWSRIASASYDRLNARSTRTTGGIARFTFTGIGVAWVAARSPVRGGAVLSVDGATPTTVDLYRTSPVAREMVFTRSWSTSGLHTVEIRSIGTPGHPRVDIDAFVVITPAGG